VQHSVRAPAVGYRVSADTRCFFYLPDVAELRRTSDALGQIDVYIGDGATVKRSMVRRKNGALIGHAPITRQLDWCANAHVRRAIFTHCGSPIVRATTHAVDRLVSELALERGVNARIARDGDRLSLGS
jgi:phosphoribosyl 1,2-cyclic phosphodiesterase